MLLNIREVSQAHRGKYPNPLPDPRTTGRKRGRRAGVLTRLRLRAHRAPLPSMLLANVQSLENKLRELRARIYFQPDIKICNVICLAETWLSAGVPDHAIAIQGFSIHRSDRDTVLSGKKTGGGVCLLVNRAWCDQGNIVIVGTAWNTSCCSVVLVGFQGN